MGAAAGAGRDLDLAALAGGALVLAFPVYTRHGDVFARAVVGIAGLGVLALGLARGLAVRRVPAGEGGG